MDAETGRLAALHDYGVLDTPADPTLDKITALAAELFETPSAAISLIDARRQWMMSRVGDVEPETSRDIAICDHTIREGPNETLFISDARLDPRFRDSPLVTKDAGMRFYLGAPLMDRQGHALGALCVFDSRPRAEVSAQDRRRLQVLAGLVVDELELRRAAKKVAEAQRLLALAESMAGVGHWSVRKRDFHVTWSDEVYRIHGVEREGFNPNLQKGVSFYHPDDQAKVSAAIEQAFATRGGFSFELRLRRADGAWRKVASRAMCELDGAGDVTALFGVFQDVTEQAELVEAAQAASRAKSDFLANMSHELRTPLNSIIGFTHVLVRDDSLGPEHRHKLTRIEEAGRGLLTVVNDVLDFSKLDSEGVKLSARPFSPIRLMENLVALVHPQATDRGLSLVADYPLDRHVTALGDVDRLRQVLMNLLTNAVKFTARGEVRLALQTRLRQGRVQLTFQVSDSGIGIEADQIASLFQRFSQADGSISRRFGGTGLGLAISKRLVEAMDGSIEVRSEIGRGATFEVRLTLPAAGALAEAEAAPRPERTPKPGCGPLPALRVLVAEDVPVNQELVRLMLAPLGCKVTVVGNGEEAVEAAGTGGFGLILMDMQMPVLDGLEATRAIRRLSGPVARIPIVALTANVLPEQIEHCRKAGMNDHVAKPFVTEDLQSMVLKWAEQPGAAMATSANPVLDDLTAQIGVGPIRGLLASLDAQMAQVLATDPGQDGQGLSRLAHSLRGAAGALGYADAARACQEVEAAHRADRDTVEPFALLQAACDAARTAMGDRLAA